MIRLFRLNKIHNNIFVCSFLFFHDETGQQHNNHSSQQCHSSRSQGWLSSLRLSSVEIIPSRILLPKNDPDQLCRIFDRDHFWSEKSSISLGDSIGSNLTNIGRGLRTVRVILGKSWPSLLLLPSTLSYSVLQPVGWEIILRSHHRHGTLLYQRQK